MRDRSPDEYRQTIAACQRAAVRMQKVVESLLTLARADAGALQLAYSQFDLRESVENCLDLLRPLASERQVTILRELQPVVVEADRERITQAITNLLANAILYNRPEGRVEIRLQTAGKDAQLTIIDTGQGIPPADLPHVFERFYRVDKARSAAQAGSGLGLAICREIVEGHGGRIELVSEPDRGTTATLWVPLRKPTGNHISPEEPSAS